MIQDKLPLIPEYQRGSGLVKKNIGKQKMVSKKRTFLWYQCDTDCGSTPTYKIRVQRYHTFCILPNKSVIFIEKSQK